MSFEGNGVAGGASNGFGDPYSSDTLPAALVVTPRQAFELARLLDRHGDGLVSGCDGVLSVLIDADGVGSPTLALELDGDGEVVAHQPLTVYRDEPEPEDGLGDLEEAVTIEGEPVLDALRDGALLGRRCRCDKVWPDGDGGCSRCGCPLPHLAAA